jgi:hypothetical protein
MNHLVQVEGAQLYAVIAPNMGKQIVAFQVCTKLPLTHTHTHAHTHTPVAVERHTLHTGNDGHDGN